MSRLLRHFTDTYYLPSWQGGDAKRPLCHRGRLNLSPATLCLSTEPELVTCNACRKRLGLPPLPVAVVERTPLPVLSRVKSDLSRAQIALEVAVSYGVRLAELRTVSRKRVHAWPRQVAMVRMMEAGFSSTAAAAFFYRDHTTALAARSSLARRMGAAQ